MITTEEIENYPWPDFAESYRYTEVAKQTKEFQEMNKLFGKKGGLLLAPAHILDPAIPWENIVAFVEAAKAL